MTYCSQCKTWKPVNISWSEINTNKWPSHRLCSFTFFPSISNHAEPDIWATETLLDPWKALQFSHVPWAVDWKERTFGYKFPRNLTKTDIKELKIYTIRRMLNTSKYNSLDHWTTTFLILNQCSGIQKLVKPTVPVSNYFKWQPQVKLVKLAVPSQIGQTGQLRSHELNWQPQGQIGQLGTH